MAEVVRMLSQRWVRYRRSLLSVDDTSGHSSWPRPGDRLPDQEVAYDGVRTRLHELTATAGVHVILERDAPPLDLDPLGGHVSLHRLDRPGRGLVAVRPDGFVGFRCDDADPAGLGSWLDLVGAR